MSKASNTIKKSVSPNSLFDGASTAVSSAISWNQGDLLYFDNAAHLLKPIGADADTANFCGIARNTVVNGQFKSPYPGTAVDAAQGLDDIAGPVFGVEAEVTLTTGETYHDGDLVYPNPADPQQVTTDSNTAARSACGIYRGPTVTAAAGQKGTVYFGCQYPNNVLKF